MRKQKTVLGYVFCVGHHINKRSCTTRRAHVVHEKLAAMETRLAAGNAGDVRGAADGAEDVSSSDATKQRLKSLLLEDEDVSKKVREKAVREALKYLKLGDMNSEQRRSWAKNYVENDDDAIKQRKKADLEAAIEMAEGHTIRGLEESTKLIVGVMESGSTIANKTSERALVVANSRPLSPAPSGTPRYVQSFLIGDLENALKEVCEDAQIAACYQGFLDAELGLKELQFLREELDTFTAFSDYLSDNLQGRVKPGQCIRLYRVLKEEIPSERTR